MNSQPNSYRSTFRNMLLLIALTIVLALLVHYFVTSPYGYWKKRGIPFPKPLPFVGNVGGTVVVQKTLGQIFQQIYNDFTDCVYVGIYKIRKPAILIRDPELIRDVLVKKFSHFHDNDIEIDENEDPIMAKNPFCLRGHRWKVVRAQVTSNITTGKIKSMYYLMTNVGKNLVEYLKKNSDGKGTNGLEAKELAAKFTTDVVATCAFGLEGKSFIEPNAEFRKMGKKFLHPSFFQALKHMVIFLMPSLAVLLKVRFIPKDVEKWFTEILLETIKYRKENNVVRNDYLDMMLALKEKPGEYEFKDIDVIAQAMTFYADGFETSSIALSFSLYEIASNKHVQEKLQQEIETVLAKYGGEITYDAVQEMTYLECVLCETLRKYPPGTQLFKICTKPCKFPPVKMDGSGSQLEVPEGMSIIIPVQAIHHDPQYYPNPDKFDPDRFTNEAKESRPKCTFIPFGEGPRQCLGYRFAFAQTKAAIVSILLSFDIKVNKKTKEPIEIDPSYFMMAAKGGLWLNFYKRKKDTKN